VPGPLALSASLTKSSRSTDKINLVAEIDPLSYILIAHLAQSYAEGRLLMKL